MPPTPSGPPRYTPETANALLPEVRKRLGRLRQASALLARQRAELEARAPGNGAAKAPGEWVEAARVAAAELSWFNQAGIVLRDIETGLLDFPAVRDGRPILLCWRSGEPRVAYWHDPGTGFAGRQPL